MNPIIDKLEKEQMKKNLPNLEIGSTLKITFKIEEENKERLQSFTGVLIAKKGSNSRQTVIIRKVTGNFSVEKNFFVHSPLVTKIEVIKRGKVRQAKLYYLRDKIGKAAKIKEKL